SAPTLPEPREDACAVPKLRETKAAIVSHEEPARLTGSVILVSGRSRDKPVDLRDAVEARMGGRLGSRNPSACAGLMTRTPSRCCASAIFSCSSFILVQCIFGRK